MVFKKVSSTPRSAFESTGYMLEVTDTFEAHECAESPGADRYLEIKPQKVELFSNGYYVKAMLSGKVTARGHYGGELGGMEDYRYSPYAYEAEAWLSGEKKPYYPIKIVKK